jgi:hypothetical protein
VEHSFYCLGIGVREGRIERDPKDLVAYLNNVDVGQLLWRAEPRDKSGVFVLLLALHSLALP